MKEPTLHDASPEDALSAIRAFDGPLLIDLDETAYLSNSTEDFIDCAWPGFLAVLLLGLLERIRPWRWSNGALTRDVWRVRLILLFFPWTTDRWRRRIRQLCRDFGNTDLIAALRDNPHPRIVVTMGFHAIVAPLVQALDLGETRIIAARLSSFVDRLNGKLALTLHTMSYDEIRQALLITDSTDDLSLLDACARPLRTRWPGARYRTALRDVYLPGRYLIQVKRPGERYIVRSVLQDDFAFWLLSSVGLSAHPLRHAAGLLFLLLSFWTIYECGYIDNDRIGARHEVEPKLSDAFHKTVVATPAWQPWIWASLSGMAAIVLLRWPTAPSLTDGVKWLALLFGTYGWFLLYNRFDKHTRIWLYSGLQLARTAAFAVLVPISTIGAAALGSHVLSKWMPYYVYRTSANSWPEMSTSLIRLLFFTVIATFLALAQGLSVLLSVTALSLLAWNLFRARNELHIVTSRAHRLDHLTSRDHP